MRSTTPLLVTMAVATLLMSGCSQKNAGQPTPETGATGTSETTPATTSTNSPEQGFTVSKFASDPCSLLKADQTASLGTFKAPEKSESAAGKRCTWAAQDVTKGITYSVVVGTSGSTFADIAESSKGVKVYRQTTVDKFPAVSSDSTTGQGNCTTAVGAAPSSKEVFLVQISTLKQGTPEYTDSCGATEKVAALVVQNLKG